MKKKIIFLLQLFLVFSCKNENKNNLNFELENKNIKNSEINIVLPIGDKNGYIKNLKSGCSYNYRTENNNIIIFKPNLKEVSQIKSILKYTGLPLNFEILRANVNNAFATIIKGKRYIIYDENLFEYIDTQSQNYWTSMSILAHEIGHHLSGHTLDINKRSTKEQLQNELEADEYSGFILYKMGANLKQAQFALSQLGTEKDTDSHPAKDKRLKSIEKGWNNANESRNLGALPPPQRDDIELTDIEYNIEDIWDINDLKAYHPKYNINTWGIFEGIITDVIQNNKTNYQLSIYITKNPLKPLYITSFDKILIDANFNGNLSMYQADMLPYILKAGRKVKFAFILEGAAGRYANLSYLKTIQRN